MGIILPEIVTAWVVVMVKSDDSSYFQFRGDYNVNDNKTSTTFLVRLQDRESGAWKDFMDIYVPLIKFWCRKRKSELTHAERQDILQEVLQSVSSSIGKFDHTREERSFRGWLRRITRNRICDHLREKVKNEPIVGLCNNPDHLNVPVPSPVLPSEAPELEDIVDPEEEAGEQRVMLKQVLKRIRPEFREKSWDVFHLLFIAEKDAPDVAKTMNMKVDAVRQLRSRILKRIREEFASLSIEDDPSSTVAPLGH